MTPLLKGGVALITVGTVSTAGYFGGTYLFGGTPIKDLINEEFEYKLLDTKDGTSNEDNKQWETNWNSYKEANKDNVKDFFELEGWTKGTQTDLKDKLRKKCEELSKSKIQSKKDKLYTHVTTYCGRRVSIKDQAKKDKLTIIDTSKSDANAWAKFAGQDDQLNNHLTNLEITAKAPKKVTSDEIKEGCKKAIDKNKADTKYEQIYASYKVLCANQ